MEYLRLKQAAIIVLNWNGWRDTLECLESLLYLNYPEYRVVVCDNGSEDDSVARIRTWFESKQLEYLELDASESETPADQSGRYRFILISIGKNLGFAGGNNVGIRYALGWGDIEYCWLLNNDTVVEPDALHSLVTRMEQDRHIGMCGSTLLLYHARDRIQALGGGYYIPWIGLPWHYRRFFSRWQGDVDQRCAEARMNYVEGASILVSRRFIETVGLMCEDYFLYFEEADWALRAAGRFSLGYAPASVFYHKVGSSIGTTSHPGRKSYTCDYYNIRNRLVFTRRFFSRALPVIYLVLVAEILLRLCYGRWERAKMILSLMLGKGVDPGGAP